MKCTNKYVLYILDTHEVVSLKLMALRLAANLKSEIRPGYKGVYFGYSRSGTRLHRGLELVVVQYRYHLLCKQIDLCRCLRHCDSARAGS
jgi:hypothetical protein